MCFGYLGGISDYRILRVFYNLCRVGNQFGKWLTRNVTVACDHVVGAAGKAGAAQASGRIVEHHKAHFAHPFFGVRARPRNKAFVVSVDGD